MVEQEWETVRDGKGQKGKKTKKQKTNREKQKAIAKHSYSRGSDVNVSTSGKSHALRV